MDVLAFDGRMGASGDMLLGALLAVGSDRDALEPVEVALDIDYRVESVSSHGLDALRVQVVDAAGAPIEGNGPHRTFDDVVTILEDMTLPVPITERSIATFRRLGTAEATVHGTTLDETHFHEVGADDAIADIVGTALLLADLDVDQIVTTPLSVGGGEVDTQHGTYPVPPPAVVAIAEGASWSIVGGPVDAELLTPTGAAILAEYAEGTPTLPSLNLVASGYGAGSMAFDDRPNVLRAIRGLADGLVIDDITVLETTVDDVSPEVLGGLHDSLSAVGARDVAILPTAMKKSRPGHLVQVIVKPEDADRVAERLAVETGTLGIRETGARHRWIAERSIESVTIALDDTDHTIEVKVGRTSDGDVYDVSAEFDDAAAVAETTGRPVREVMRLAEAAARDNR